MSTFLQIDFYSVNHNENVSFDAYITAFGDTYDAGWNAQEVFGRMDPIATYKNTKRTINCSFTIPAADDAEIIENHKKFSKLLRFMYPTYEADTTTKTATIKSVPFFKVKYANLIYDFSKGADLKATKEKELDLFSYSHTLARDNGLLGYISQLKYDPNMESNQFVYKGAVYFQSLNVTFTLNVLHTARVGFDDSVARDSQAFNVFPYGLTKTLQAPQPNAPDANLLDIPTTEETKEMIRRGESNNDPGLDFDF